MATLKLNWRKCPSVTYGGKPNFWVTMDYGTSLTLSNKCACWVIWDRAKKHWIAQTDYWTSLVSFSSPRAARNWVEKIVCNQPTLPIG